MRELAREVARYARAVADKRIASLPGLLFAVLGVIDAARPSSKQIGLPPLVWLIIAMACLMGAQFLVWRDAWLEPVEPIHGGALRSLAARIRGQVSQAQAPSYSDEGSWTASHMFDAHFPKTAAGIAYYGRTVSRESAAHDAFFEALKLEAFARFQGAGWMWGGIYDRCKTHLVGVMRRGALGLEVRGTVLVWATTVLYDGPDADGAQKTLLTWLRALPDTPTGRSYREAREERAKAQALVLSTLDPFLHNLAIHKALECRVCFPPRS